jgi:sulfonate transport system permease protein
MSFPIRSPLGRFLAASGSLAMLAGVLGMWWLVSHSAWISRAFLPTPEASWESLVQGLTQGDLAGYTLATLWRMLLGWLLASLAGVVLGGVIGTSHVAKVWVAPTLELLRPLPASAVMPLAIAVFGLSSGMVLAVVAFGAMWPVLLATIHGFGAVHPRLVEVGQALQLTRSGFIFKIGLPNALPDILAGMRLSMTVSLIVAVVGEMISSQALLAARSFQASDLFAGIALLGLIGFTSNAFLVFIEKQLLRH